MDVATSDFLRTRAPVGRENEKVGRAHVAIGASDALLCLLLADKSERKQPAASAFIKAGERTRTVNIQLGRLTLYQLSYARSVVAHCSTRSHSVAKSRSASKLKPTGFPWRIDRFVVPSRTVLHLIVLQLLGVLLGVYLRQVAVACASCTDSVLLNSERSAVNDDTAPRSSAFSCSISSKVLRVTSWTPESPGTRWNKSMIVRQSAIRCVCLHEVRWHPVHAHRTEKPSPCALGPNSTGRVKGAFYPASSFV